MVGYVTLGSNDLERGAKFYDDVLGEIGGKRLMADGRLIMWGNEPGKAMLALCIPYDEQPATTGNGVMVALSAGTKDAVDRIHAKALSLGAQDEGAPGPRGDGPFYGGYFRDLDGNKVVAFVFGG